MSDIEWNDEKMSIGHPLIDEQHHKLIDLLNLLSRAVASNADDKPLIEQTLKELCDYTVKHFSTEESLMDPESYPEYDGHVSQHMECTQTVLDFLDGFSQRNEGDLREFSDFVKGWVVNHVLGTDKTLGRFLLGRH